MKSIGVIIVGGTGYAAAELLRVLVLHPEVEVCRIVSSSMAGQPVAAAHPFLESFYPQSFAAEVDWQLLEPFKQRAIFSALPHGASGNVVAGLLPEAKSRGVKILDLSGDLRLRNEELRKRFYPEAAVPQVIQSEFVYGLVELNRRAIAQAQFVSVPGCTATGCILAAAPFVQPGFKGSICFNSGCGTSGAGKEPKGPFHHPHRHGNIEAYKVLEHRHEPEIRQALGDESGERLTTSLVPFLLTSARGIYATAQLALESSQTPTTAELRSRLREFYEGSPFIRVRDFAPDVHLAVGSNFCDLTAFARGKQIVAVAALDNMVKGTAGQAVQCLNLMCGLDEKVGLWQPSLGPV